jgi:GT2 family glycosyltransferase
VAGDTSVSVVIPTFNRRERLQRVLRALAEQTYRGPVEVVVVSDGSTDGTDEFLASGSTPIPVVAASQENQGPAAARNRAVELATGELLVFVDDDVVPVPGLVAAHVAAHQRLGPDVVVIGPMLDPIDHRMSPWVRWEQAMLAKQYDAMIAGRYEATARQFYTGNASVARRHVLDAGGFDTRFRRAEDVELAYRLSDRGLRFAFEPAAEGLHYAERTYSSWWATGYAYGRNDVVFARDGGRLPIRYWIGKEFKARHPVVRALTRWCVTRPRAAAVVSQGLRGVTVLTDLVRLRSIALQAASGIYNIAYYRGVVDELGSADEFWDWMRRYVD